MGRPRKIRVGEYAGLLAEEIVQLLERRLGKITEDSQKVYVDELNELRGEIGRLEKRLMAVEERVKSKQSGRPKVGKWVPGGPGRPPKDADERIAAFSEKKKTKRKKKTSRRKSKASSKHS